VHQICFFFLPEHHIPSPFSWHMQRWGKMLVCGGVL
jgi:hypothetical protein